MTKEVGIIKKLVWLYFILLIVEGALRKWILPSLATPLLVVRDPVVILVYIYAYRIGIYPRNWFILCGTFIAFASLTAGAFAPDNTVFVALYGFRANFLHWPLVFIMARVLDSRDIQRFGFWTLLISVPMAFLMALQFQAPSASWLNAGASEGSVQIASALDHVRSAGTFSFITGPIAFYPLVVAFLLESQFSVNRSYPKWLGLTSAFALPLAMATSGSRSLIASVAIVVFAGVVTSFFLQPRLLWRGFQIVAGIVVLLILTSLVPVLKEAIYVFNARIEGASDVEGGAGGFIDRFLGFFTNPISLLWSSPLFGAGLGMGTSAGSALLTGRAQFLLAEEEWSRVILESGPLLGASFLIWRCVLAYRIALQSISTAISGDTLPFLLFAACCLPIIVGQISQPTVLGFTVFITGLCLASLRPSGE